MGDFIPGSSQDGKDLHDNRKPGLITRTEDLIQKYPDMFQEIPMGNMFWYLEKKGENQTHKDRILATRRRVGMGNKLVNGGSCLLLESLDANYDIWDFDVQGEDDPNRNVVDKAVIKIIMAIENDGDFDTDATLNDGHRINITYMPFDNPNNVDQDSMEPYIYGRFDGD